MVAWEVAQLYLAQEAHFPNLLASGGREAEEAVCDAARARNPGASWLPLAREQGDSSSEKSKGDVLVRVGACGVVHEILSGRVGEAWVVGIPPPKG